MLLIQVKRRPSLCNGLDDRQGLNAQGQYPYGLTHCVFCHVSDASFAWPEIDGWK